MANDQRNGAREVVFDFASKRTGPTAIMALRVAAASLSAYISLIVNVASWGLDGCLSDGEAAGNLVARSCCSSTRPWRNWIAHRSSEPRVAGSNPAGRALFWPLR